MPLSKFFSFASLVALAWLYLAEPACAVAPPADAEEKRVANRRYGHVRLQDSTLVVAGSLMAARREIAGTYEVPVSFEWPYVETDRSNLKQTDISLSIQTGQTLAQTLDMFVSETRGALRWGRVHGILCLRPPDSATQVENGLDITVSLQLDSVSTWDAFKALANAINADPVGGRRIQIYPSFTSSGMAAPPKFRGDNSITLDLQDVSAREAACAIMAMSPLELSYRYSNHYEPVRFPGSRPISIMSIQVYVNGISYYTHDTMPRAELVQYMEEHHAMEGDSVTP